MKRFILKSLFVFLPFIIIFSSACFVLSKYKYKVIPFICSVSFDSKIYELKQRHFETIDNIAVGSSMTLNNLNTEVFLKYINNESFYNVSSWGQGIKFDRDVIMILVARYSPKRIIMVTSASDFHDDALDNKKSIKTYLYTDLLDIPFMTINKINTQFYDSDEDYMNCKNAVNDYTNLRYDDCGGIELNVYGDNISTERWNSTSPFRFDRKNDSYKSLIEICKYLKSQNVDLLFVNTPTRQHYYCNNYKDVEKHIQLCDSIVSSYGFFYSNEMSFEQYQDSLFADCSHLNVEGAKMLTNAFCKKYFD